MAPRPQHWWRLYDEILDDPKVGRLTDSQGWLWVRLLTLACREGGLIPKDPETLVFQLHADTEAKKKVIKDGIPALIKAGLIEDIGEYYTPHNWERRQFDSDVSTTRVRVWREQQKKKRSGTAAAAGSGGGCGVSATADETTMQQRCNVSSSLHETALKRGCNSFSSVETLLTGSESTDSRLQIPESCAEPLPRSPPEAAHGPSKPFFIKLPTNKSAEHVVILDHQVEEFVRLYPAVDVRQQLRAMCGWLTTHPRQRKTADGMLAFVNGWLNREQNKGNGNGREPRKGTATDSHLAGIAMLIAERRARIVGH